jgi:hypothetical protein
MILTGLAVAVTSRAWPTSGAKYSPHRAATPDGTPIDDWDALSEGDDPTRAPARLSAGPTHEGAAVSDVHDNEPGHGNSPAAWVAVTIMLVAFTPGTFAFWFDLAVARLGLGRPLRRRRAHRRRALEARLRRQGPEVRTQGAS